MLQDPNVERVIKNYTEPLQKQISMMQIELEALKQQCNIGAVMHWVATSERTPTVGSYVWAAKVGDDKSKLIQWNTGDESFYDVWQDAMAPKPPCA